MPSFVRQNPQKWKFADRSPSDLETLRIADLCEDSLVEANVPRGMFTSRNMGTMFGRFFFFETVTGRCLVDCAYIILWDGDSFDLFELAQQM